MICYRGNLYQGLYWYFTISMQKKSKKIAGPTSLLNLLQNVTLSPLLYFSSFVNDSPPNDTIFILSAFFSPESNSRIANVCLSVRQSVSLCVRHKNPSASQNQAYMPLCLSIDLSAQIPISHHANHFSCK